MNAHDLGASYETGTDTGKPVEYVGSLTDEHGRGILLGTCTCVKCGHKEPEDPTVRAVISSVNGVVLIHVRWASLNFPKA